MANVRIAVSKKGTLIAMIALVVLLGGGGGYLLWRVNQKDTVAPTDSSAGNCRPCRGCSTCMDHEEKIGDECCVRGGTQPPGGGTQPPAGSCRCCPGCSTCMDGEQMVNGNQCCTPGGAPLSNCGAPQPPGGGTPACSANPVPYFLRDGTEKSCSACPAENKPEGQRCIGKSPYDYECGDHCFDPSCGKEACDNISNPAPTVTLTYKASAGGSILGEANQTFRKGGDGTQVEAKANPNFKFEKWSNDNNRSATRRDTNVMESVTYIATFTSLGTPNPVNYTLTYTAGAGGSISGSTSQTVTKGDDGSPVTAVPDSGYIFDSWDDDPAKGATRTDKNIQASAIYKASFKENAACGDGICSDNESPVNCPSDCPSVCGDGICTAGEDSFNCPVDCGAPSSGKVPETAIFDNTRDTIIFGVVILVIGIAWTWVSTLPKKAYTSIKTVSKASSEYISNVKVQKERNIRESRRNRLEKRIE